MAPDTTGQQDLRNYARIFWRWKFLFAAFVILIPLGVFLVEQSKPKLYASSTLLATQGGSSASSGSAPSSLAATARLVTTTPVVNTAALLLHQPPGSLAGEVSASGDSNTGFLTITAQDRDPHRAAAVANAFAVALNRNQIGQAANQIRQQVTALQRQLAATPRSQPGARITIEQQIAQLRGQVASANAGSQVIQAATPSSTPASPKTRRAVELALAVGLLLGFGAVLFAENTDRRLRTPEDVESITDWPLLAAIPASGCSPESQANPRDQEAFQMLRAALTHFNVDRPKRSVAIVSPLVGDGKTTVAVGLAMAVARAGKRVILVDADLRRPQVSARLGMAEPEEGLGAVLAGERPLANALIEHPVDSPEGGRLLVLWAGPPSPNPVALLGSQRMRDVIRQLEQQADLVVVDTVASLAVSDALSLLQEVSGIVVVLRVNRSPRMSVHRLQKMIAAAKGNVLGVVATGSGTVAGGYGYGYGAYYPYADGRRAGAFGRLLPRLRRSSAPVESNGAVAVSEASAPEHRSAQAGEGGASGDPRD